MKTCESSASQCWPVWTTTSSSPRLAKGNGERRRLDELGTVPDDRDELHPRASVLARLERHASAATGASPDDHPKKRRGFSTSISSICCCVMPAANSRGKIRVERCR